MGKGISLVLLLSIFINFPVHAKNQFCSKRILAIGVLTTVVGIGAYGYHEFFSNHAPTFVQMPDVVPEVAENPLELFPNFEKEYYFSIGKIYSNSAQGKFFNKNETQKVISKKINEKLIQHTPPPWKNNLQLEEAIDVKIEGILLRRRAGGMAELLLVTPIGQYWFSKKMEIADINAGKTFVLEAEETQKHSIAEGKHSTKISFRYDKATKTILLLDVTIELKLTFLGGLKQEDTLIFSNIRAGYQKEYAQRPEYGAFELDED